MPVPVPKSDQTQKEFIQQCMSDEIMVADYDDTKQRYAICKTSWDKSKDTSAKKDLYGDIRDRVTVIVCSKTYFTSYLQAFSWTAQNNFKVSEFQETRYAYQFIQKHTASVGKYSIKQLSGITGVTAVLI